MARLVDTVRGLMIRFGISAPAGNGLDVIKRVLSAEEFETVATAIQLGSERLQAVEMVDTLFSGRRNDDRTNLIEEVAFKGGWRRDPGDLPSEMYLNYTVVIMEPTDDSLDAQRVPAKGKRIIAPDGTTVFVPTNAAGKIDLAVDPHTKKNVDFFVHMFKADADAAGLDLVHNVTENRYEFPVVKCRLKKHFMFACQVLVFDKEANLAWQGSFRRGQLTRQDAEKMYARLNWVGPQKQADRAALYVMMLHNNINHFAEWKQWGALTLGGETFGQDNRRFHTYGPKVTTNESPQWAVLNWIIENSVDSFNKAGINTVPGQSRPWTASEFFEFLKDDLVFLTYDHADYAAVEKLYLDVEEGDVTIQDADTLIKMTGKTTGVYSHRPRDIRDRIVREIHLAVSEQARMEIERIFTRQTVTRGDLNKFYDPDRGAFHRFKDEQDARRLADVDLLDEITISRLTQKAADGTLAIKDIEEALDPTGQYRLGDRLLMEGRLDEREALKMRLMRLVEQVYEKRVARLLGVPGGTMAKVGWEGHKDLKSQMASRMYEVTCTPKTRWNLLLVDEFDWQYAADGKLIVPAVGSLRWRGAAWLAYTASQEVLIAAHRTVVMTDGLRGYGPNDALKDIAAGFGTMYGPTRNDERPKHPNCIHEGFMGDGHGHMTETYEEWNARLRERRATMLATYGWAESILDKVIFFGRQVMGGLTDEKAMDRILDMLGSGINHYFVYNYSDIKDKYPGFKNAGAKMGYFYRAWAEATMPQIYGERNPRMVLVAAQIWEEMRLTVYGIVLPKYKELLGTLGASKYFVQGEGASFRKELEAEIASMDEETRDILQGKEAY